MTNYQKLCQSMVDKAALKTRGKITFQVIMKSYILFQQNFLNTLNSFWEFQN